MHALLLILYLIDQNLFRSLAKSLFKITFKHRSLKLVDITFFHKLFQCAAAILMEHLPDQSQIWFISLCDLVIRKLMTGKKDICLVLIMIDTL